MSGCVLVKFRHGGQLLFGSGVVVDYFGGNFDVEFIEKQAISLPLLMKMLEKYGYNNVENLYYAIPGSGSLRVLNSDNDMVEMLVHADNHKAIEVFAAHKIDVPLEDEIPLVGFTPNPMPNPMHKTPTKMKKVCHKKKLTPIRKLPIPQQAPQTKLRSPTPPKVAPIADQNSSSTESDDSVEDETYKIDLTEPMDDDEMDDDDFVDEFANVTNKSNAHETNANEINADEDAVAANASQNDNEDAVNVDEDAVAVNVDENANENAQSNAPRGDEYSDNSISSCDSKVKEALSSNDDELFEVRQRTREGRIAINSGAILTSDDRGPEVTNSLRGPKVTNVDRGEASNEDKGLDAQAQAQPDIAHAQSVPHAIRDQAPTVSNPPSQVHTGHLNFSGKKLRGTIPRKSKWPDTWTSYEEGYQFDPRNSDGALVDSEEEENIHRRRKKRREMVNYSLLMKTST